MAGNSVLDLAFAKNVFANAETALTTECQFSTYIAADFANAKVLER